MKALNTILTIMIAALALAGIVFYVLILLEKNQGGGMIIYGGILVGVTAVIALFFGLSNLAKNPQALKKSLISLAVFAIVGILSYVSAGESPLEVGDITITESTSKLVGTGINMFYFLAMIAVLAMVGFAIKKSLNK